MNSLKLLAAIAAFGIVATPAIAQTTNTMGNTMGGMGSGSMMRGSMDKPMMDKGMMDKGLSSTTHMMPMHHMAMSKKTMARCHKMSHARMMKSHQCGGMMKHGKMMKHAM
jgi:hypothetical protein